MLDGIAKSVMSLQHGFEQAFLGPTGPVWIHGKSADMPSAYFHEMGHQFWLHHAGEGFLLHALAATPEVHTA